MLGNAQETKDDRIKQEPARWHHVQAVKLQKPAPPLTGTSLPTDESATQKLRWVPLVRRGNNTIQYNTIQLWSDWLIDREISLVVYTSSPPPPSLSLLFIFLFFSCWSTSSVVAGDSLWKGYTLIVTGWLGSDHFYIHFFQF